MLKLAIVGALLIGGAVAAYTIDANREREAAEAKLEECRLAALAVGEAQAESRFDEAAFVVMNRCALFGVFSRAEAESLVAAGARG